MDLVKYSKSISLLIFIISLQFGYLFRVTNFFNINIKLYMVISTLIIPLTLLIFYFTNSSLKIYKSAVIYITFQFSLVIYIGVLENIRGSFDETFLQILALGFMFGLSILLFNTSFDELSTYLIIGGLPVIIADLAAVTDLIQFGSTSYVVFPGFETGGIGIDALYGEHGISVLVSAIAAIYKSITVKSNKKIIYVIIVFLSIFVLFLSQSRSSVLAFAIALTILIVFLTPSYKIKYIMVLIGGFILTFSMVLLAYLRPQTLSTRIDQIYLAFNLLLKYPLTGIGWDVFSIYSGLALHFTPLSYFVSTGFFGGILFIILFIYPIVELSKGITNTGGDESLILVSLLAMYIGITVEIFLYPSTPNVPLLSIGLLSCHYSSRSQ